MINTNNNNRSFQVIEKNNNKQLEDNLHYDDLISE